MRSGGRYVLGIDALPRGEYAAVAVGRTIASTFRVVTDGGQPLPLAERVRVAVADAEQRCGAAPSEVRLVCIDDADDGAEIEGIQAWLTDVVMAQTLILDMVTAPRAVDASTDADGVDSQNDALSVARACEAALW